MLLTLFSAVFLIFLIYNPALCTLGATKGLSLWYKQVLPALFPAMAAASFLISRKSIQSALKHLPFPAGTAFLSGLLCGSPMERSDMQRSLRQQTSLQADSSVDCLLCSAAKPTILSGFVASTLLALLVKIRFVFFYVPICRFSLLLLLHTSFS